jgi:hypothetical protein
MVNIGSTQKCWRKKLPNWNPKFLEMEYKI